MNESARSFEALAIGGDSANWRPEAVAVEEPLQIGLAHLHGIGAASVPISVTMRTPGADAALAVGYLFTEGILTARDQVYAIVEHFPTVDLPVIEENTVVVRLAAKSPIDIGSLARSSFTSSSCGVCGKTSIDNIAAKSIYPIAPNRPTVSADVIRSLPDTLRNAQAIFDQTGGLHASALFTVTGELVDVCEDVGRHNALDKVIGKAFLADKLPLSAHVLMVSGRASFELVQKASMAGIPILAAVGAPSSLAVELARDRGMTLIGFLRGNRFNVYAGTDRITLHE